MEGIEININNVGTHRDIVLLRVRGYVDTTTSPELQKTISRIMDKGRYQLLVDLSAVNYVSSAGWGVFVGEIRDLRENGGDIKIAHMTADVFEVFEILEFNQILTYYDSIEEAMFDFDFCRGLDLTSSLYNISAPEMVSANRLNTKDTNILVKPESKQRLMSEHFGRLPPTDYSNQRTMDDADLPLSEKVKQLVIENPLMGTLSIKRRLNTSRFGNVKVSYFEARALLKTLGLDTKARRRRFFRSR